MADPLREHLLPYDDDRIALGSPTRRWSGIYTQQLTMDGSLDTDGAVTLNSTLDVDGATTLNSTLDVDGAVTLNGAVTLGNAAGDAITSTGAFTASDTLTVTGAATFNGTTDLGNAAGDTVTVTGAMNVTSLATLSGGLTLTSSPIIGIRSPAPVTSTADTIAPANATSGTTWFLAKTSATQVVTLPAPLVGQRFTFVCGHADGEILINATDATTRIVGKGFDVTAATGIKNTAATNVLGDTCSLVCLTAGVSGVWIADVVTGTWAAQ